MINFKINVNGMHVKIFPLFAVINSFAMAFQYFSIAELQQMYEQDESHQTFNESEYKRQLYYKYRNMLVHLTNIVLVFQVFIAARQYEKYAEVRVKFEALQKSK